MHRIATAGFALLIVLQAGYARAEMSLMLRGAGSDGAAAGPSSPIHFVADGNLAEGASSATPTVPAGISLGDMIIICATARSTVAQATLSIKP
jgi:hypothetical protein